MNVKKSSATAVWLFLAIFFLLKQLATTPSNPPNQFQKLLADFQNLQPDPAESMEIKNFRLSRDVGSFLLEEGRLFLGTPLLRQQRTAIFVGRGMFEFTPPMQIEKEQLSRFYKTDSLNRRFSTLFLFFSDSTLQQLSSAYPFVPQAETPPEAEKGMRTALKYLYDGKRDLLLPEVARTLLNRDKKGVFLALFYQRENRPLIFEINPYEEEEVRLYRKNEAEPFRYQLEVINQFPRQSDFSFNGEILSTPGPDVTVQRENLEVNILDNLDFFAHAQLSFQNFLVPQKWFYFELYPELEVDSAFSASGEPLNFFRKRENPYLWIEMPDTAQRGDSVRIEVFYHGRLLERRDDWIYIADPRNWYPRTAGREKALFDLKFHTPAKYEFVSVGNLVESDTSNDEVYSHWVSSFPIRNAGFNIGIFQTFHLREEGLPEITVFMSKAAHAELKRKGIYSQRGIEKQVASDVARSIDFFNMVFGVCPFPKIAVTETPAWYGEAFPGLIHLGVPTFIETNLEGYDQVFRAHEVAHQWWGIGVDFKTYHDQWLSEGFAQYAGLWYLQVALHENEKYLNILKKWKEQILHNRKYLLQSGPEAGPIWLGYRTRSSATEEDYNLIVYKKSAWVMHMLRNLLRDLDTMQDNTFILIMRNFFRTYLGKQASTEDFRKAVEKYTWKDMNWFFQQWVYGTEIPTYRVAHKVIKEQEQYQVKFRVQQENVSKNFRMEVPVTIRTKGYKQYRFRFPIVGPFSEFETPLLAEKPRKIIFNDNEAVLCEVKKMKWEEKK